MRAEALLKPFASSCSALQGFLKSENYAAPHFVRNVS